MTMEKLDEKLKLPHEKIILTSGNKYGEPGVGREITIRPSTGLTFTNPKREMAIAVAKFTALIPEKITRMVRLSITAVSEHPAYNDNVFVTRSFTLAPPSKNGLEPDMCIWLNEITCVQTPTEKSVREFLENQTLEILVALQQARADYRPITARKPYVK